MLLPSKNPAKKGSSTGLEKIKFYKKKWFQVVSVFVFIIFIIGGYFAWKTGSVITKISKGGLFDTLIHNIPGIEKQLKGEEDGRVNLLLMGMRGENVPGGGLLADTVAVISIKPEEGKVAMISIPRDLFVQVPDSQERQKINAINVYGEKKGRGQGLEDTKKVVSEVTGLPIHYGATINFAGFKQLIDAIGGVEIVLENPFSEPLQFKEAHVCDPHVYTVKTNPLRYEIKKDKKGRVVARYPLCYNKDLECGGEFNLPAGKQTLDGEKALCYVRSRVTSSDFERAKRQQLVIQLVKDKMVSMGTLADFSKVSGVLDALGDNVRSDMEPWEMQKFYDLYRKMENPQVHQRVLENSEEGLLYSATSDAGAYILLPIGNNYDRIREMSQNIFNLPLQSNIKPK